jgi:CRP/FNR family transcriptional regulator, anaerobic regulatory protein
MHQKFIAFIEEMIHMPDYEKELCYQYFEPIVVPKNTIIEKEGKVPKYLYFIISGYMRNYHFDEFGNEITIDLNHCPRFFTSYNHFVNRTISNENIECITDCELLRIKRDDVDILFEKSPVVIQHNLIVMQKAFEDERNRLIDMATLTAEERYFKFIKQQPNIIHNVPLQHIASYLGMKPESLSRIRKKFLNKSQVVLKKVG